MFDEAEPGLATLFLCPLSDASSSGSLSVRELRRLGPFAFSVVALVSLQKEDGDKQKKKKCRHFLCYIYSLVFFGNQLLVLTLKKMTTTEEFTLAVFPHLPQITSVLFMTVLLKRPRCPVHGPVQGIYRSAIYIPWG